MKKSLITIGAAAMTLSGALAQWQTTTYELKGGWNTMNVFGDVNYGTLESMLPADVIEVWRWNNRSGDGTFSQSPAVPAPGTPEWSIWKRGLPAQSTLTKISRGTYLVRCSGAASASITVPLKQAVKPPVNVWQRTGANLLGFPTMKNGASYPLFNNYFSTFASAIATNAKVFKYVGGDLTAANPIQIFSTLNEPVDRTKAYWFSSEVVGNFVGPYEISLSETQGLTFGRSGSLMTATIRNRTTNPVTLTFTPETSEAAPVGQPGVVGAVPLTRRTFNTTTANYDETPITAAFTETLAAQASVKLEFGIDRASTSMQSASAGAFFASFLRMTDSANMMDVSLPATATKSSLAGLWVGDVQLNKAGFTANGAGNTASEFPLRTILHLDDSGTARLLSQAFIGKIAAGTNPTGITTRESLLKQDEKATAQRLSAAHLPLDQVITTGSGNFALGSTLTRTVQIAFNEASNPFVHQYHPDHDNKSPRGAALPAGVESYTIARNCSFTFASTPPVGTSRAGWGSTVIGGTYSETITGLHRDPITLTGTFELQRASELGVLHQP
jgi:hypothetical protein